MADTFLQKLTKALRGSKVDLSQLVELDAASAIPNLRWTKSFRDMSEVAKADLLRKIEGKGENERVKVYMERLTGRLCYVENSVRYWIR